MTRQSGQSWLARPRGLEEDGTLAEMGDEDIKSSRRRFVLIYPDISRRPPFLSHLQQANGQTEA